MKTMPSILTGNRVVLKPMDICHIEPLFKAGNAPRIWRYMSLNIETPEQMESLVHSALQAKERGAEFPFVIIDKNSNEIIGSTRFLAISAPNKSLEIGWTWLAPECWRTAVNTECKYLLLKYCFEELGTIRVQLKTDSRNEQSQRAIERIGAVKEGVLRNHMVKADGYARDSVYYSIIDREWPAVKERLEHIR